MNKSFNELNINQSIVMALKKQNITTPTGIQETSIPFALENKDIIAEAHTCLLYTSYAFWCMKVI